MKSTQVKTIIKNAINILKKYWAICILTFLITIVIKYFCRVTDSDALKWILTPTARWVSVLGGIPFEYIPHMGYVNHYHRFLFAPACSGTRFMLLTFLMCIFSFLYQIEDRRKGYLWFVFSAVFAYASTIFVNGLRIIASIYIPIRLEAWNLMDGRLTQDRLHTMIGTGIYFSSLLMIYMLASFICRRIFIKAETQCADQAENHTNNTLEHSKKLRTIIVPSFWYLSIVLALPFLSRLYHNEWTGFGQYAAIIICTCSGITLIMLIVTCIIMIKKNLHK
ncbi:MAG: exosortase K [Lachnospiraceae bacterium]|nr:exosortase K [Lachnospiraceae bacterium]